MIGQDDISSNIMQSIDYDRYAHATLIEGQAGYGTLPLALLIASYLVCQRRGESHTPCGECSACGKSQKFIHPDIHYAFPVVSIPNQTRKNITSRNFLKEWRQMLSYSPYFSMDQWIAHIAKASAKPNINVTECNQIIQQLNLQSFEGGAKVQIIWMASYLGGNGNKLLKLIEEPPENTYIILVINQGDGLINTIRSRCQSIIVPRIADDQMVHGLQQVFNLNRDRAMDISFLAEGDWISARQLLEVDNKELFDVSLELLEASQSGDFLRMRDWSERLETMDNMSKKAVIAYTLKLLKEIIHINNTDGSRLRIAPVDVSRLKSSPAAQHMTIDAISMISQLLSENSYHIDRNAHTKIMMYNSCLEIESIINRGVMYGNML